MPARFYGVVIRTRNLDAMRRFFSDTLNFGPPVVNSNFWIEFEQPGTGIILALEKDETAHVRTGEDANVAWVLTVDNLPEFEQQMADKGFGAEGEFQVPSTGRTLMFRDPDGNRLLVNGN